MNSSFLTSLIIFLSGLNDHFPTLNKFDGSSLFTHEIIFQKDPNNLFDMPYLTGAELFNFYSLQMPETLDIYDMQHIFIFTSPAERGDFSRIDSNSFILVKEFDAFQNLMKYFYDLDFYNINNCIVIIFNKEIINQLTEEEIVKIRKSNKFVFITDTDIDKTVKIFEIIKAVKESDIQKSHFIINASKNFYFSAKIYILVLLILIIPLVIFLSVYFYSYTNLDSNDKLHVQSQLIFVCVLIIICLFSVIYETLLTENIILNQLPSRKYWFIKIFNSIVINTIIKNFIFLIFLLVSRGYCILFFDSPYKRKYFKLITIISLCDLFFQIIFSFTGSYRLFSLIFIKDFYNIFYLIFISFFIHKQGEKIQIALIILSNAANNGKIHTRTHYELLEIIDVIKLKTFFRKTSNQYCYNINIFAFVAIIIYQIVSKYLIGNILFEILILLSYILVVVFCMRMFKAKKLVSKYTMTYEELIEGVPDEFLNEYLYNFGEGKYLGKAHDNYGYDSDEKLKEKIGRGPIVIINPFEKVKDNITIISNKGFEDKKGVQEGELTEINEKGNENEFDKEEDNNDKDEFIRKNSFANESNYNKVRIMNEFVEKGFIGLLEINGD